MKNISTHSQQLNPGTDRPRRLLLCLDGVPHKLIEQAKGRGLFRNFGTPTRLLSPFPTMTNVALAAMFGASPPAGYESLYFDKNLRELRGGIRKYLGRRTPDKIPSSYMDELDYQEPLAFEFLIYVAPEKVWRADMRRFREKFGSAPQTRDFFAFLKGTDGLLHAQGPKRLATALETLDTILTDIQEFCGRETEIVMFSDHGMNLEDNRRVHLASHLNRKGFKVSGRLSPGDHRSVAVPAFGLCSYAAAYCGDRDLIPEVAQSLTNVEGIDFVVYRDGESAVVEAQSGSARIERRAGSGQPAYAYFPNHGDPFQLAQISASLVHAAKDGFAADDVWYEKTKAHMYPDVLANVYSSLFSSRVQNDADILISIRDGYYYGWSAFGRFVRLAATHGNARKASSDAFVMSTHRTFQPCVRADDARMLFKGE